METKTTRVNNPMKISWVARPRRLGVGMLVRTSHAYASGLSLLRLNAPSRRESVAPNAFHMIQYPYRFRSFCRCFKNAVSAASSGMLVRISA